MNKSNYESASTAAVIMDILAIFSGLAALIAAVIAIMNSDFFMVQYVFAGILGVAGLTGFSAHLRMAREQVFYLRKLGGD